MRKYPKYKKSKMPWIGDIPEHWNEKRAKYFLKEVDERSTTGDEEMLSVSHLTGVTPRSQKNVTMFKAESNVGAKICKPGDLVINTMWAWMSAMGVSNYKGVVSPSYSIYRAYNNWELDRYYLDNLIRIDKYRSEYICRSTGIRSSRLRLYPDRFLSIPILCPPRDEQICISKYLKKQNNTINKIIKNKRRIIELLKEQIENKLFGYDENNTNIKINSWNEAFPRDWKMIKAKRLFNEIAIKDEPEKQLLAVTQDRGVLPKSMCEQNYVSPSGSLSGLKLVKTDSFVISLRAFQGGIEYSEYEGIVSPAYNIFTLKPDMDCLEYQYYYKYIFKTKPFISMLNTIISGIRDGKNISYYDFSNLEIPVPPKEYLRSILANFKEYENRKQVILKERKLIEEYRSRLISDVVTGKIDIRGILVIEDGDSNSIDEPFEEEISEELEEALEEVE